VEAEVMSLAADYLMATREALEALADPDNAAPMAAYLKGIAPFLGVKTPERRAALTAAWRPLPHPDATALARICLELWALDEREFQYAACDLIGRERTALPAAFLAAPVQGLITAKSWWDTVDSLGTAAVSPITRQHPSTTDLMWQWLDSGNTWLVRAAIQHQRGRGADTDTLMLYAMCDRFAEDREFFIAKAIGWALRDMTRWHRGGVQAFVDAHPHLSSVARREAVKGLGRSALP
jgi:3-methyladenine DNA glycosylase AlkD